MNGKTMDQIVLDTNKFINSEVEKHVFQWIGAVKGIDFANLLQEKLRDLVKMEQALKERDDAIEMLEFTLKQIGKADLVPWYNLKLARQDANESLSKLADLKKRWAEK